jgi:hypothetical protein
MDQQGRPVFSRGDGAGFMIVVEGRPGSGGDPGASLPALCSTTSRPDMQLESDRQLGTGAILSCPAPGTTPTPGPVQGFSPPDFGPSDAVTYALQNLASGFVRSASSSDSFTFDNFGNTNFVCYSNGPCAASATTTAQFAKLVQIRQKLPPGDTILTVQLRDSGQNLGPTAQIVVRVATPTPTP